MPKALQMGLVAAATAALAVVATAAVMGAQRPRDDNAVEAPELLPPVRIGDAALIAADMAPVAETEISETGRPETDDAAILAAADPAAGEEQEGGAPVPAALWKDFTERFVTPDGRVIDDANGSISHSEGQGYGMLLAAFAGDETIFRRLWTWTETELLVRDDGLAAWRWEPDAEPHITDLNNASDGDILIAWALMEASDRFGGDDYHDAAENLARAIHANATAAGAHGLIVMPGTSGFGPEDRPDGPVVNLSYWVFPAFPQLQRAAPDLDWDAVIASGLELIDEARFGKRNLPSDWIALGGGHPRPANGFPPSFAYNAIRVPLYLAWGRVGEREDLAPFMTLWSGADDGLATIDLHSGAALEPLEGAGYRAIAALVACAMEGRTIPGSLRVASSDPYYPTVLQALSLVAAEEILSGCR